MIKNEIFYNVSFLGHGHNDRGDPGERTCRLFNLRTRHTIRNKIFSNYEQNSQSRILAFDKVREGKKKNSTY